MIINIKLKSIYYNITYETIIYGYFNAEYASSLPISQINPKEYSNPNLKKACGVLGNQ